MVHEQGTDLQISERVRREYCEWAPRAWPLRDRLLLAACVFFLVGSLASAVLATPQWSYNGTRLIPSYLLALGHRALELHGKGPLYSTHYGPLTYIVYLPATLFHSPNAAVLAGSTLTIALCLISIAWLHFGGARWRKDFWAALLGFTAAGYLVCYLEPLRYSCVNIHADGPAIAFGSAACALLRYRESRLRLPALISSATFAVAAALCKQPMALLTVGLIGYLWLARGQGTAIRYAKALCGAGLILGGACIWIFGAPELYYNLSIAARQPWGETGLAVIVQPVRALIRVMFPVLLVGMAAWMTAMKQADWKFQALRWLRGNDCAILFAAGLAVLPSSLVGFAKIGGDVNSLSFSSFFFTIGVTCMLADVASEPSRREVRLMARGCLLAIIVLLAVAEFPAAVPRRIQALRSAEQQFAYDYLRANPHTTFFPWFPLSHVMAEGRFYHWSYGIIDRVLAGEKVSPEYFRAYAPAEMANIAFGKDGARELLGIDLLSFWGVASPRPRSDPALPSWEVYGTSASLAVRTGGSTGAN